MEVGTPRARVQMSFEERQRSGKLAAARPHATPIVERLAQAAAAGGGDSAHGPAVGRPTAVAAAGRSTELVRVAALHGAGGAQAAVEVST